MVTDNNYFPVPNAFWESSKGLDIPEKIVYLYLASRCYGEKSVCYPSLKRIANDTGLSLRTVKDKIRSLKDKNVITVGHARDVVADVDTRQHYYSLVPWTSLSTVVKADSLTKRSHKKKGATSSPDNNRAPCTNNGEPFTPRKVSPLPTNNTTNNTNTITQIRSASPREDSVSSLSTEQQDQPNALEGKVMEPSKAWNYSNKPRQLKQKTFATNEQLKNAIYSWFSGYSPEPYKYKKELEKCTDFDSLSKGFRYINYWKENYIGRGTLGDFVNNAARFAETGETCYLYDSLNFCRDNRERLVAEFIRDNGLYDITKKENRIRLASKIDPNNTTQIMYYKRAKTLFVFLEEDGSRRLREYMDDGFYCLIGGEWIDDLDQLKAEVFEDIIANR